MAAPWALGARVRIMGEIHGQQTVNVLHFASNTAEFDVAPPSPLLDALLTAVLQCAVEALLPAVTQDWTLQEVNGVFIYNSGGSPLTDPQVATPAAGAIGELSPQSVSFASSLLQLRTGVAGRRGRGRLFLPPAGETEIAQSTNDASVQTLLVAFANCMVGKFLGPTPTTDWRWGILSRKTLSGVGGSFNSAFHLISSITPAANVAVIGRRKKGRGD